MSEFDERVGRGGQVQMPQKSIKQPIKLVYYDSVTKPRAASFLSAYPIISKMTLVDFYWAIESIIGVGFIYFGTSKIFDSQFSMLNSALPVIGLFMILWSIFRILNFFEEEINAMSSFTLVSTIMILISLLSSNTISKDAIAVNTEKTFSYYANTPDMSGINYKPNSSSNGIVRQESSGVWVAKQELNADQNKECDEGNKAWTKTPQGKLNCTVHNDGKRYVWVKQK